MAINFLNNVNFNSIQTENIVIENFASNALAGDGVSGQVYWNTTVESLYGWDGTASAWIPIGTQADILTFKGGAGADGTVDLNSEKFTIAGTADQIVTTSAAGQTLTLSFPTAGVTLPDGSVATTQTAGDNTTKVATDAFVTTAIANIPAKDNYVAWNLIGTDAASISVVSDATITVTGSGITAVTGGTLKALTLGLTNSDKGSDQKFFKTFNMSGTNSSGSIAADANNDTGILAGTANQVNIIGGTKTATWSLASGSDAATRLDLTGTPTAPTPTSGDNSTRIATTAFVQDAVVGNLQFKGGFRASTGAIDPAPDPATFLYQLTGGSFDASKARLAIAVGDYYVVTVAGNFFGNSATPLTPGDSVIAQKAALANASVEADFIVVQSDTDLATYATVGLGNVNVQTEAAGSAITAGYVGQATGLAAGGIIEIDYATDPGTAALSVRESTAAALGVVTVEGGSGIDVTYTDGVASIAIDASASPSTKLVDLNDADAAVERTFANGITTYDLEVDNTDVFGAGVLSANVIAEVQVKNASIFTGASVGMTVYAEITRTVTDEIKFSFAGNSTDNSYKVWLTRMA